MSREFAPTLDCQDCGVALRRLSRAEALMVAENPYNYVVYCHDCQQGTPGRGHPA